MAEVWLERTGTEVEECPGRLLELDCWAGIGSEGQLWVSLELWLADQRTQTCLVAVVVAVAAAVEV